MNPSHQELYKQIGLAVAGLLVERTELSNGAICERGKWVHIENIVKSVQRAEPNRWASSTILRRINEMPKLNLLKSHPSIKGLYGLC